MNKYYKVFETLEELIDNYVAIFSDDDQENVCRLKNIIVKGLQQRKKEHELLELYREYHIVQENSEFYKRLYTSLLESNRDYHDDYLSYKRCEEDKDKIMERIIKLEDELKEKE
jgi:hypothetical protein